MSCIKDSNRCKYTGELGYCCSGNCIQNAGDEFGFCANTTTTTIAPRTTTESSKSEVPVTDSNCLKEGAKCRYDGGVACCSLNCFQLEGQPFGKCMGSHPPTNVPEKCLEIGQDCKSSGSLGFCCSEFCKVIAPHTIGICALKVKKDDVNNIVQTETPWIIYISVAVSILVVLSLVVGFIWLYYRQKKLESKALSRNETDQFFNGNPEFAKLTGFAHENVDYMPYNRDLEIQENDFEIDMDSTLGSGCYGLVLKGKVKGMDVAAKTIRSNLSDGTHLRSLLSEIKTLQYIGKFENVVSLVGCYTENLANGKVFLFLEFCPFGSLEKYLRANKYNYATLLQHHDREYANKKAFNQSSSHALDSKSLLRWCLQITNAMKFLAGKKVIHADLATRNVLLLTKDCAKLTDFGLSRRLYEYGNYVKKHQEPLPWKWMAIESLSQLSFSHQSDVWSLGITFWEIYSLGDVPYPGLSWTSEFISLLQNNLRPVKPSNASDELYDIMLDCWKPIPELRPTFEDIYKRLYKCQERMETL